MRAAIYAILCLALALPAAADKAPRAPSTTAPAVELRTVEPSRGDADGGTYAKLVGHGFATLDLGHTAVYFGDRRGTIVRTEDDEHLIVEVPAGKAGEKVDVRLVVAWKLDGAFTFAR